MADPVELENIAVPVIGMRANGNDATVIVGASPTSPVGPAVCVGASATLSPGQPGLALVAHMPPDLAYELADKIRAAAAEIERGMGVGGQG